MPVRKTAKKWRGIALLWGGVGMLSLSLYAADVASSASTPTDLQALEATLGQDPGPAYKQIMRQWAQATRFAENASDVAVGRLKLNLQQDPRFQKLMTPAFAADLQQFFYELFFSQEMITDLSRLYAQYLTLDELQELVTFYKSPLGIKIVQSSPELNLKSQAIGTFLLKKHEREYLEIIAKHVAPEELKRMQAPKTPESQTSPSPTPPPQTSPSQTPQAAAPVAPVQTSADVQTEKSKSNPNAKKGFLADLFHRFKE